MGERATHASLRDPWRNHQLRPGYGLVMARVLQVWVGGWMGVVDVGATSGRRATMGCIAPDSGIAVGQDEPA